MTIRWERVPAHLRDQIVEPRRRARDRRVLRPEPGTVTYRCGGVQGCGQSFGAWKLAERCADSHGGARVEIVMDGMGGSDG